MISRRVALASIITAAWTGSLLRARVARAAQLDRHYRLLSPARPVATADRVEVIEFFWYGCPYCFELQPLLDAWLRRKPADTAFRRIPAFRRDEWAPHVRIFYTLVELGEAERLHRRVHEAYHVDALAMSKSDVVAQWAEQRGVDREQWLAAYASPAVDQAVEAARESTLRYEVPGTPSFVVDGRYLTSSAFAGSVPAVIPIVDELIELARSERARR